MILRSPRALASHPLPAEKPVRVVAECAPSSPWRRERRDHSTAMVIHSQKRHELSTKATSASTLKTTIVSVDRGQVTGCEELVKSSIQDSQIQDWPKATAFLWQDEVRAVKPLLHSGWRDRMPRRDRPLTDRQNHLGAALDSLYGRSKKEVCGGWPGG